MKRFLSAILFLSMVLTLCSCNSSKYKEATELMTNGDYASAKTIFSEIIDYKDSEELIAECKYKESEELMANGDYTSAKKILTEIKDYKNSGVLLTECEDNIMFNKLLGYWISEDSGTVKLYMCFKENGTFGQGISLGSDDEDPLILDSGNFSVENGKIECNTKIKWELNSSNNLVGSDETGSVTFIRE